MRRTDWLFVLCLILTSGFVSAAESQQSPPQTPPAEAKKTPPPADKDKPAVNTAFLLPRLRADGLQAQSLSLWDLAVDEPRQISLCYHSSEKVRLWRKQADEPALLTLQDTGHTRKIQLKWPPAQSTLDWPLEDLPLHDQGNIIIGQAQTVRALVLHELSADFTQLPLAEQLAQLLQRDCQYQYQWLLSHSE